MKLSLKGKNAIITGGSRGIGRAIALKLGGMGASVTINYAHNEEAADGVALQIREMGGEAIAIKADMKKVDEIESLFDVSIAAFGQPDILVNNAGMALYKRIEDFTEADFDALFALNVKGVFFACRQAARKMADNGRIVNISSTVTKVMMPNYGGYAATKGAVEQITRVLAKELGLRGITVNAVSPGPTDTELFKRNKTQEQVDQLAAMSAFNRIGTPDDIADVVALLVSDRAGWISGENICANGGFIA